MEAAPITVKIGSELSGIVVGNDSSAISEIEVIYMLVEVGIDSSICDGSVGISLDMRSDRETSVVWVGNSVDN